MIYKLYPLLNNFTLSLNRTYEAGRQAVLGQVAALDALSPQVDITPVKTDENVEEEEEDGDRVDENEFNLKGSVIYQPFTSSDNLKALSKKGSGEDPPGTLMRARTSSQLIDMAKDSVHDDQRKIADFIKQIKSGELQSQSTSEFRTRRLTYSAKTDDDIPSAGSAAFVDRSPPAALPIRKSAARTVRTTIFASSEIGTITEKAPPFPDSVLGTYSCHGIEPSYDEEDGIHEKINQDRGCVVCPYNAKKNEALFMVLDGHGGEGDKVSEFVMRQVRMNS